MASSSILYDVFIQFMRIGDDAKLKGVVQRLVTKQRILKNSISRNYIGLVTSPPFFQNEGSHL